MALQPYRYEDGVLTLGDEVMTILFFADALDMPWVKCRPFHNFLGATNISQTLARVHNEDKMSLKDLVEMKGEPARTLPTNAEIPNHDDHNEGKTIYINESGLYAVALKSTKPEAMTFQRWVTTDVLPSIRRTGGYVSQRLDGMDRKRLLEDVEGTIRTVVQDEMKQHHVWSFSKRSRNHRELMEIGRIVHGQALRELDQAEHVVRIVDFLRDRIEALAWAQHGRKFKSIYTVELKRMKLRECREEGLPPPVAFNQGEHRIVYTEADADLMIQVLVACEPRFEAIAGRDAHLFLRPRRGQRSIVEFMQPREASDSDAGSPAAPSE